MTDVSIVMCAYNAENTVAEAIESILSQSAENFELIFVNDGSVDRTLSIASFFAAKDQRMTVINQINRGVGLSRNTAISHAKGKYIAFLDADDIWSRRKLEYQLRIMNSNSEIDILITDSIPYEYLNHNSLPSDFVTERCNDSFERIVTKNIFFQPQTSLVKKDLFELALFTDDYSGQDYYPFFMFALHNKTFYKINYPLYGERSLPGSLQRSPQSSYAGGLSRFKAVRRALNDPQNRKFLSEKRVTLLESASDRYLKWSTFGARDYMTYAASIKYAFSLFGTFIVKRYYFIELFKAVIHPLRKYQKPSVKP